MAPTKKRKADEKAAVVKPTAATMGRVTRSSTRLQNGNSVTQAPVELPKKKKAKTVSKKKVTEEESVKENVKDNDAVVSKTIVIEHRKQCNSFKTRALQVKKGLEVGVSGIIVQVNPDKMSSSENDLDRAHLEESQAAYDGGSSSGSQSRGRGRSKPKWFVDGKPTPLTFDDQHQPVGDKAKDFRQYLAFLAKDTSLFPLNVKWNAIPFQKFNRAWEIYSKTIAWTDAQMGIPTGSDIRLKVRIVCEAIINSDWRSFRQYVKKEFYTPQKDKHRPIICSDSRIPVDQWLDLVKMWDTPESKSAADTNKQNRKQLTMHHTAGTRPYAMHRYDFEKEGHQPNSFEFYCKTHQRRDKSWIDHESEQHAEKISSALEELPPEIRNTPEVVNKVFEKEFADRLVGHGRVFGRGVGVKPSMLGYSNPSTSRALASTTVELEMMKAKFEASEAERARLKADTEKLKADAEAEQERMAQFQQNVNAQLQELRHELSRQPPAVDYMALQAGYFQEHRIPWMSPFSFPQSASQQFSIHQPNFVARPLARSAFVPTTSYIGVPQMSDNVNYENTPIMPTGGSTMLFRGLSQMPVDSTNETNL